MMLRVRDAEGITREVRLHPQYIFSNVVRSIEAAVQAETTLTLDTTTPGEQVTLDSRVAQAIALVEEASDAA